MEKGLRTALWVLSSLAVLWTALAIIGLVGMGAMMHGGMMSARGPGGTMDGMMGGGMIGMMLHMGLTWIVMLGLVGVFIYLIVTARRHADSPTSARPRQAA
jgi:uncharacterized membrane protein